MREGALPARSYLIVILGLVPRISSRTMIGIFPNKFNVIAEGDPRGKPEDDGCYGCASQRGNHMRSLWRAPYDMDPGRAPA